MRGIAKALGQLTLLSGQLEGGEVSTSCPAIVQVEGIDSWWQAVFAVLWR